MRSPSKLWYNQEKERGAAMKKLGLVGAMSPETTAHYYTSIVNGVREKAGEDVFPHLALESLNTFEIVKLCQERRYDDLADLLTGAVNRLAAGGADFAAFTSNTPHLVFDRVQSRADIPMVGILDGALREAVAHGYRRVGFMGSRNTQQNPYYLDRFQKSGVELVLPEREDAELIHSTLHRQLVSGTMKHDSLSAFQRIVLRMRRDKQIQALVLAYSEMPLLVPDCLSPVPLLSTSKLHIADLIDRILE